MRTLKFIVNGQIIEQDPNCDFANLVPGTDGYLQAEFSFSPEWDGCAKVAFFKSVLGTEYEPQVLKDGRTCVIPPEALTKRQFKVGVVGKNDKLKLKTNTVTISQNGGKHESS